MLEIDDMLGVRFGLSTNAFLDVAENIRREALAAHDQVLLGERNGVVGDPVHNKTTGKAAQHKHEDPWHPCKDHLLCWVGRGRVQFLLQPH